MAKSAYSVLEVRVVPVYGIKRRKIVLQIPDTAYEQIKKLARESDRTVPGYIRRLIYQELTAKGLPIYIR